MKTNKTSFYSLLAIVALFTGIFPLQAKENYEKKDVLIPLHERDTLVVIYGESMIKNEEGESSRFGYFKEALTEEFNEANLSAKIEFTQLGYDKEVQGDYVLTIMMGNWEINSFGEYECRFFAAISDGEQKINLGTFIGKKKSFTLPGSEEAKANFVKAARKAIEKLTGNFLNS
jgi:hypothetical protein